MFSSRAFKYTQQIYDKRENKREVLCHKDALVNLGELDVPYKTKKQTLVQEGGNFIQDFYPCCK